MRPFSIICDSHFIIWSSCAFLSPRRPWASIIYFYNCQSANTFYNFNSRLDRSPLLIIIFILVCACPLVLRRSIFDEIFGLDGPHFRKIWGPCWGLFLVYLGYIVVVVVVGGGMAVVVCIGNVYCTYIFLPTFITSRLLTAATDRRPTVSNSADCIRLLPTAAVIGPTRPGF